MKIWVLQQYDGVDVVAGAFPSKEAAIIYNEAHPSWRGQLKEVTELELRDDSNG